MRSRIRKALNVRANGPWIIAAALLVALMVAPFAGAFGDGNSVRGGARNPSPDSRRAYSKETQIIANVNTYGTRQSNKSNNGGGAVYGCRSPPAAPRRATSPACAPATWPTVARSSSTPTGAPRSADADPTALAPDHRDGQGMATALKPRPGRRQERRWIIAAAQAKVRHRHRRRPAGDQRGATASARSPLASTASTSTPT